MAKFFNYKGLDVSKLELFCMLQYGLIYILDTCVLCLYLVSLLKSLL